MGWSLNPEALLTPEGLLILTGLVLLLLPARWKDDKTLNNLTFLGLALALLALLVFLSRGLIEAWLAIPTGVEYFGNHLRVDLFSQLMKTAFVGTALMVVASSRHYMAGAKNMVEFYLLLVTATLGMFFVASAQDLLTLFVGLELTSLSSYALVAHRKQDAASSEAGTKYFIIGAFSSALALYGMSLVYGAANTLNLEELRTALGGLGPDWSDSLFVATLFLLAGFGFKVAIVPFHAWAPDVYQGAPTTITAFLAAASKLVGFVVLFKVFVVGLIGIQSDWRLLVAIIAVATMTLGNIVAISQTSFRRMLAYSSIAQAGYVLIALPVVLFVIDDSKGNPGYNDTALLVMAAALAHLIIHIFMKGGTFLALSALSLRGYSDDIHEVKGLVWRRPMMAFAIALFMFSLAGIPPLAGFWSKFWLFAAAVKAGLGNGPDWLIGLAVAGVINSALSLYYYLRIVRYMFVPEADESSEEVNELSNNKTSVNQYEGSGVNDTGEPLPLTSGGPVVLSAILIGVILPVLFGPLLSLCSEAVKVLLGV